MQLIAANPHLLEQAESLFIGSRAVLPHDPRFVRDPGKVCLLLHELPISFIVLRDQNEFIHTERQERDFPVLNSCADKAEVRAVFPYVVHNTYAVCLLDPQFYIWKSAAEFRQDPRQQIGSRDGGRGYDHSARSLLRRLLERVFNFFREFNDVFCVNINLFAGLCQGNFFCRSVKELLTQFAFQLAYVCAHRRLCQI